jgi:hypothetical protein
MDFTASDTFAHLQTTATLNAGYNDRRSLLLLLLQALL